MSDNFVKLEFEDPEAINTQLNPCFANPEIVSFIFRFLDAPILAVLARTVRAFTEPALNCLWQGQRDLVPLFQCFPRDLWVRTPVEGEDAGGVWEVLSFCRPLDEGDWPRFEFYARRIRRLEGMAILTSNQRRCDLHPNVVAEMSAYRPARKLVPNLQILIFTRSWLADIAATPFGQMLLGPSVKEVSINATDIPERKGQNYTSLELLCVSLQRLCPNLRLLSFQNLEHAPVRAMPAVYRLISSQKHLLTLSLKSATPSEELIAHLAKLPDLHTLIFVRIPQGHIHLYNTREEQFRKLRVFVFESPNWLQSAMVLAMMQRPFTSLSVRTLEAEPISALQTFVDSLSYHPSLMTLACVNITAQRIHLTSPSDAPLVPLTLRTLFSCSALQQLQLHSPVLIDLDDTWLEGAAKTWPVLTLLSVTVAPMRACSRMTLKGLVPLIKSCPLLDTLCLPIKAAPVDWKLLNGVRNDRITKLSLGHSTIVLPGQVFRTLIAMFPNLRSIEFSHSEQDGGINGQLYMAWQSVNALLLATSAGVVDSILV